MRITNSKAFLAPSIGLSTWSGRMEIIGFECHDCGLSIQALASGFWIDDVLAQCRTGEPLSLPPDVAATFLAGDGFGWYDTDQEHIITRAVFKNCGYNANHGVSDTNGCGSDPSYGCSSSSSVFSFLTHSSQFNPEIMQVRRSNGDHLNVTVCISHDVCVRHLRESRYPLGHAKRDHGGLW